MDLGQIQTESARIDGTSRGSDETVELQDDVDRDREHVQQAEQRDEVAEEAKSDGSVDEIHRSRDVDSLDASIGQKTMFKWAQWRNIALNRIPNRIAQPLNTPIAVLKNIQVKCKKKA